MAGAGDMVTKHGSRPVSGRRLLPFPFLLLLTFSSLRPVSSACPRTCDLALGSYYLNVINSAGTELNLTYVSSLFGQTVGEVLSYNPNITNPNLIFAGTRVNISFSCDCLRDSFLGHTFSYTAQSKDTYAIIAGLYANLTTVAALEAYNAIPAENITANAALNVTVNCSCGDPNVSKDYGFFITYPLRSGDSLQSVANASGLSEALIRRFNPGANFNAGEGIVFIPAKDRNGSFRPIQTSKSGLSVGAIGGIVAAVVVALLVVFLCFGVYRRKKWKSHSLLSSAHQDNSVQQDIGLSPRADLDSKDVGFNMEKSIEFTYEELSTATNGFSMSNKIGEGGFGAVFYAELRGEKAAIKKMDMEATREFLAELKVLANVHHLNLVRLIGYCTEGSLFLVYEYIENGNLSQHLRGSRRDPLPWPARVKIALDSARGLEYIHEHTVPVYVHRDIKSANILIDNKFRAKVADFGLTKLTHVGNASQVGNMKTPTRLVGTFGYMPPEYAQYGEVSPKVDVYAFGVVLFELISAKEAIVKLGSAETKGLISLFDEALSQSNDSDRMDNLLKLVDPRLGDDYPIDSVLEMTHIAKACTDENPLSRPTMRTIVVALMALSASTEDWDIRNFHKNDALLNLMSGR